MTKFERTQKKYVFFEAGKNAWLMNIGLQGIPYKDEPSRSQWLKGWHLMQRTFSEKRRKAKV